MRNNLLRPLGYLRAYPSLLIGIGISLVVTVVSTLLVPQVVKTVIDSSISANDQSVAILGGLGIIGLALLQSGFRFTQGYWASRAAEGLAFDLRNELFAKLESLGFGYHDRAESGQLIASMTTDVDNIKTFVDSLLSLILNTVLIILGIVIILLVTNFWLALISLIVVPPMIWLLLGFQRRASPLFGQTQWRQGSLISILQENVTNARIVRVFGRQSYEENRFGQAVQGYYEAMMKIIRAVAWFFPLNAFLATMGTVIIIGVGGYQVIGGGLSLGELVAFNTYFATLINPLFALGSITFQIASATASAKRLYDVIDLPADLADAADRPGAIPLPRGRGEITFDNVSLRYPGAATDVLRQINFTIPPGQFVAIVGPTGSGKTSLVHLIPRFYGVTDGRILIDGHDIRDVTRESLRQQIGIALQSTQLFRGTIRENIAFGNPEAGAQAVEEAARLAQAASFIEALPQSYDTVLGEGGAGLSGGQRQRLALARALLNKPPILILDDSTSALDAETEQRFVQALQRLPYPCTRVVIAERASTIARADAILVIDQGQLVAASGYQDLLQTNRVFAALFGAQAAPEVAAL